MIQQLAHEAGFRSQSVFYKQFKLATGLSPKAYINNLLLADTQATK
jgi:AraC-like DNA-binding protein